MCSSLLLLLELTPVCPPLSEQAGNLASFETHMHHLLDQVHSCSLYLRFGVTCPALAPTAMIGTVFGNARTRAHKLNNTPSPTLVRHTLQQYLHHPEAFDNITLLYTILHLVKPQTPLCHFHTSVVFRCGVLPFKYIYASYCTACHGLRGNPGEDDGDDSTSHQHPLCSTPLTCFLWRDDDAYGVHESRTLHVVFLREVLGIIRGVDGGFLLDFFNLRLLISLPICFMLINVR